MSESLLDPGKPQASEHIVTHVFCPLQLPSEDDRSASNDRSLVGAVASAAHLYNNHVDKVNKPHWQTITRMLDNLHATTKFESLDRPQTFLQLSTMNVGDVIAFPIQAQNAAVVFRKKTDITIFESFELSPQAEDVMSAQGKLICSYPGPAIEISNSVFESTGFLSELANFLVRMNNDLLDAAPTNRKARSTVVETRDTTHPRYITGLLTGIMRGVGQPADIVRITKRVGDDVVWNNSKLPWRRSPLWLLIRVVIQTSLDHPAALGYDTYKQFMLYFMCRVASGKFCAQLSNDLVQCMLAKLSRRLRKLGSSTAVWLSRTVLQTCTSLRKVLEERWRMVQDAQRVSPLWAPSQLNLAQDKKLSLLRSGKYLQDALANHSFRSPSTASKPNHHPRGALDDFLSSDEAVFKISYHAEPYTALYDVERAVELGIDAWVDQVRDNDKACVELEILANEYSSRALTTYAGNPELLSVMLLTTVELWIALDKVAIKEIPILVDYSPEVPTSLLHPLLLCKATRLRRLHRAHQYLSRRHAQSLGLSVFSSSITIDSFAIRFYRASSHLRRLKSRIEKAAQQEVREKVAELEKANARHAELEQEILIADHQYAVNREGVEYHVRYCSKCHLQKELEQMKITVHEWPLPAEQLKAEIVVFELDCPVSFNMWRTATLHLLIDICTPSVEQENPYIRLTEYAALEPYLLRHPRSRATIGSDTKPFIVTHYSRVSIPTTQKRVCVNNGLEFYAFDSLACACISTALGHFDVRRYCTHKLGSGPYQNLQKFVDTTSHTSNEVVANQVDCDNSLSIHEYISFGHLRSGSQLQWLNILRELRSRSLTFRCHQVHLLLAQTVSQVGPPDDAKWKWHQELQQPAFCYALLEELENFVRDVTANWLEGVTMNTISFILCRLLSSSPDKDITLQALGLLRTVRSKAFFWVEELSDKLIKIPGDDELRGFLRDTAAICRGTFDVDLSIIQKFRLLDSDGIKILLSCAILIHDNTPSSIGTLPPYSRLLLDRDRSLSLTLENIVKDVIQADSSDQGINLAVSWVWPEYRPGSKWAPSQNPNSRWFWCSTAPTSKQSSQMVCYNLLDGSLLVEGKPLGRLPDRILQHSLYRLIFGEHLLEVIPGDIPGMDYSTRGMISGHQVYFSLRNNDSDLVIRAKRGHATNDSDIIELIPREKLKGDLPEILTEGHTHWLNISKSFLEIRPLRSLWESSSKNWKIDCTPGRYCVYRGSEFLVDVRSQSWDMVSRILRPFDVPLNLLVCVSPVGSNRPASSLQLSVALPRYGLSFYVDKDGDLQSRNMRGMVYDEDQSLGTLFGLINRIVLRPKARAVNAVELIPRCVLIPEGKVSFRKDGHHVRVEVDTDRPALGQVAYETYRVDTDLGCLTGNVSLINKLFCVYLHALTSGCDVDPLTGRLGIEEALSLLQSASCSSIIRFGPREADLLTSIASITPTRTWYPAHRRSMQRVKWLNLPSNSQHHEFYIIAKAIKGRYERIQLFQESQLDPESFQTFPLHDDHLLERSARRAAYLLPPNYSDQASSTNSDVQYIARDLEGDSREQCAIAAATAVHRRTAHTTPTKNILSVFESWPGSISRDAALSLQYDRSWLSPHLPSIWLKGYMLLRTNDEENWFRLLFSLPAMAYGSPSKLAELVPVFIAFALDPRFRLEDPPNCDYYNLSEGYRPSKATLRGYVFDCAHPFEHSPESITSRTGKSGKKLRKHQSKMYNDRLDSDASEMAEQLLNPWPCETPPPCSLSPSLYDVENFMSNVEGHFLGCYRNLKLKEHLARVQNILDSVFSQATPIPTLQYSFQRSQGVPSPSCTSWSITVNQLFARSPPSELQAPDGLPSTYALEGRNASSSGSASLKQLINTVETNAVNAFQHEYALALRSSAECFGSKNSHVAQAETLPTAKTVGKRLVVHYTRCRASYNKGHDYVKQHLGPGIQSEEALAQSGQWPRVTAFTLFRFLASNSSIVLPDDWKRCLTQLTLLALALQRARRLLRLHLDDLREELYAELQNEGCDGWNAEAHPDWLLIQLQGNFLIRRVQAEVAREMISPSSGSNTAMQLNMGEGKSSVIVPIVVSVLADGAQVVRVIVPKALTSQMFHILADRLSGLLNRRIYVLPFSRSLEVGDQKVAALAELMLECMKERGILVIQPEAILSLKLVSVEKQLPQTEERHLAQSLLRLQRWLHSHSRDLLDESDEILHVRYQLVYTIGLQQHVEGFPERWTTTEQVLGLVNKHASSLRESFPLGIEYECGPSGSFPHLRILHADAGERLISWIVQDIINGLLPNFNFGQLRSNPRDAIQSFISCENIPPAKAQLVKDFSQQSHMWGGLLLLRGLLATGILLYAFKERRWRVDYGLAPARTMLAVPYRAKDVPAQRAEFGHPDIAIVLTCLSYFYGGLTEEQLRLSFDILLKQDDPSLDYDLWVRDCPAIPKCMRTLSGINVKSSEQWNRFLIPLFSRNKATIDFYLSNVVFPKEAKEFPSKLSCSGWDLAETKERLLTGFSGTNDSQHLLPLPISQRDPDHQQGTNAKVLSYVLQQENDHYMCTAWHDSGKRRTTCEFLDLLVQEPEIRVLLDVGAQMLDLQNYEVAKAWLARVSANASAAIYFNEDDELTVLTRDGSKHLLISSPFAQQLDQCLIYLDDAHTRGTDIKFPRGFRAAVTLGPKVTKDRLVQGTYNVATVVCAFDNFPIGCMRMRKLGHGHTLMFFAPLEVDRRIRSVAGKGHSEVIDTKDILQWAIRETCDDIQRRAPHWAQQGLDHKSRCTVWTGYCRDELSSKELSDKWLQPEAKRLEDLYGPHNISNSALLAAPDIHQHCARLGVVSLRDVGMDEEQEREVIHEIEREREVERPQRLTPATHSIHQDVAKFIKTGKIPAHSGAFRPAFQTLDVTSAAADEAHIWSPNVLVTMDFEKTVTGTSSKVDDYLRPVQWVVSGNRAQNKALVILSPFEVNRLLPGITSSNKVHLHVYTPRVTRPMKSCDDLALYSIPAVPTGWTPPSPLVDQLSVFAGQLYLNDYETYIRLCRFLCVYARDLQEEEGIEVGCDGFISPNYRPKHLPVQGVLTFQTSPLDSLRTLMGIRRKGMRFALTHMGNLVGGRLLSEGDFDDCDDVLLG